MKVAKNILLIAVFFIGFFSQICNAQSVELGKTPAAQLEPNSKPASQVRPVMDEIVKFGPVVKLSVSNDDFVSLADGKVYKPNDPVVQNDLKTEDIDSKKTDFQCVIQTDTNIAVITSHSRLLFQPVENSYWDNLSKREYLGIAIRSDAFSKFVIKDGIRIKDKLKSSDLPRVCCFSVGSRLNGLMRISDLTTANPALIIVEYKLFVGNPLAEPNKQPQNVSEPNSNSPSAQIKSKQGLEIRASQKPQIEKKPVYKELDQIVDLSALKAVMSFSDAVEKLRYSVNPPLNVVVIWLDLEKNADIYRTTPINMEGLSGVKLSTALKLLLEFVGGRTELGYVVQDGVIVIATKKSLPKTLETSVYDVTDLVSQPAGH